jgi:hypothetical protein
MNYKTAARSYVVLALILGVLLAAGVLRAQEINGPLLVMISIDGLRPDYVTAADAHGAKVPNLRAAFFVVGPGIPPGRDLALMDMRDVAPTVAKEAGLSQASGEGKAVLP